MNNRTTFALSEESRLIAAKLQHLSVGETLTYESVAGFVGLDWGDPQDRAVLRSRINTAREIVLREYNIATGIVFRVGIKRICADEVPSIGTNALSRIRRTAERTTRRMERASAGVSLTPEQSREVNTTMSALGAVRLFSSGKATEKIRESVSASGGQLPLDSTIALFRKGSI